MTTSRNSHIPSSSTRLNGRASPAAEKALRARDKRDRELAEKRATKAANDNVRQTSVEAPANDLVQLDTLGRTIVARVEKGDRALKDSDAHFLAAGLHLNEAHALVKRRAGMTWSQYLDKYITFGRTRVYMLMALADGRLTMDEVRANNAARAAACRAKIVAEPERPLRNGQAIEKDAQNQEQLSGARIARAVEAYRSLLPDERWAFNQEFGLAPTLARAA